MPKQRLHPCLQRLHKRGTPFGIVEVANIAEVSQVKRNVLIVLRNEDYFAPKRVGDARLIEHIGISRRTVAHHDARTVDQGNHILNDCSVLPERHRPR
jgi:hypothetical protein